MGGGQSGTQTTTQSSAPWSGQQPYLQQGFQQAANLYGGQGPQYFPFSTVTPFSGQTEQALQMGENRAMAGSPNLQAGQAENLKTLGGDYLSQGNPYMDQVMGRIRSTVQPGIESRFAGSGRIGSGAHAESLSRGMSDAIAPYAFNAYESERGRMGQAAAQAPGLGMADYGDIDRLGGIGARREGLGQEQLQDLISRFNYGQQQPYNQLQGFMGTIGGNYGQQQTTQTPLYQNRAAGALGGGLSAAMMTSNPWLWGAGALLGGI